MGNTTHTTAAIARVGSVEEARARFVGRAAELERGRDLLEALAAGRGGALLVLGEPGVGKSRLLAELARSAGERGFPVARAACLPLSTPLPFDAVLELLRSLRRGGETDVAIPEPSPGQADIFTAAVRTIEDVASRRAVVLVLDDLHFSDAATLELVHYCIARLTDLPVAWLLAARPVSALEPLEHYLTRERLAETAELGGLSREEVSELISALLNTESVSDALTDAVHARTRGNAFLCEELLRSLAGSGGVVLTERGAEAAAPVELLVPGTVAQATRERMARLPASARALLEWSAIFPEPLQTSWLAGITGVDDLSEELATLVDASFLTELTAGGWRISHALVRDIVLRSLTESERVRRHGVVADQLAGEHPRLRAPQLAEAGRANEAAQAYLELAASALLRGGAEDARTLYERAESLAREAGDDTARRQAVAGLVLALLRVGALELARERAEALLSELRAESNEAEQLRFLSRYAVALWDDASDLESALGALKQIAELMPAAEDGLLANAALAQAHILDRAGEPARALPFAEQAVAVATTVQDRPLEARALITLGLIVGETRDTHEGIRILHEGLALATAEGLPAVAALAFLDLSYLSQVAGDERAAEEYAHEGLSLRHVPAGLEALLRGNAALGPMNRGDLDAALAYLLSAQAVALRVGPRTADRIAIQLSFVQIMRGELDAAEALLEGLERSLSGWESLRTLEPRGMLLEERGDHAAGLACYREGGAATDHPVSLWCLGGAVRAAVALGELETAREALARLDELGPRWPASAWLIEAGRGILAGAEGRAEQGAGLLEAAAEACPEAFHAAGLRLESARLRNDRKGIMVAIAAYDEMGARRAADRARALARSLGLRPGRRRAQAGLLSEREQEIARLVAAGSTNAEVAGTLFLSPRTVERHVGTILKKLGYRSRVQLAAEAAAGRLPGTAPSQVSAPRRE